MTYVMCTCMELYRRQST